MKNNIPSLLLMSMIMLLAATMPTFAIVNNDQSTYLSVSFISQSPDPVEPGTYVDVRWRVSNLGGKADEFIFELNPEYPFSLEPGKSPTISDTTVGSYESTNDGAVIYYRVRVAPDAIDGTDSVLKLSYYKKSTTQDKFQIETPIRIESRQGQVNIEQISLQPAQIQPGSYFNISVDVANLASKYISTVRLTMDTAGTGFVPVGQTNQQTVNIIEGGSTKRFTFQYFVDGSASIKTYEIPLILSYYDSLGRNNTLSTKTGIPLAQSPRYLSNLERTDIVMGGQKGDIVVGISNVGKSDMNFVVLELLPDAAYTIIGSPTQYLGNLKSDDLETGKYTLFVKPTDTSAVNLRFKIHYRDSYDQSFTSELTLQNPLYTQDQAQSLGLAKGSSGGIIIVVIVVIVIIVAIILISRRRSKHN